MFCFFYKSLHHLALCPHVSSNCVIRYREVADVEKSWEAFRKQQGITTSNCPKVGELRYEKRYERFVLTNYPNKFKNWLHFDNSKSFSRNMQDLGLIEDYLTFLEEHCDFLDAALANDAVAAVNHELLITVKENLLDTVDDRTILKMCVFEALKFCIPIIPEKRDSEVELLLVRGSSTKDLIKLLRAPMGGSII